MHHKIIEQCASAVERIETWLDKAEQHAAAKRFDAEVLMDWRLAPDMGQFIFQIQSACDYLKGIAVRFTGQQPPAYGNTGDNIADARERIRKTVAFVRGITENQLADAAQRKVTVSWIPEEISGEDYLITVVIPNVYFHVSMAHAILRQGGVDVGKRDFLGPIYPNPQ
jgi:hypothetical protein